jgi:hypothetical protein
MIIQARNIVTKGGGASSIDFITTLLIARLAPQMTALEQADRTAE